MKYCHLFLLSVILSLPAVSCKRDNLLSNNVANASVQLKTLVAASEQGTVTLIPSTFKNGQIVFVPKDDWVSGFFAGTLWEMYALTGDAYWAEHAARQTENIDTIKNLKWHHDIGFMIGDSFGAGLLYGQDKIDVKAYQEVMVEAARSLATRFRPGAGIIQSWNVDRSWQVERGWRCPVIIDNMMNLELLFKASEISGDQSFRNMAISHADVTMANHFRPDYSCFHVVDYDPGTGEVRRRCTAQGFSDESAWARGQAWALYGYTMVYKYTKDEKYLDWAKHIFDFIYTNPNMPEDLVPYWDYDCPDIPNTPRDVSSAAIMASASYDLYCLTGETEYRGMADKTLKSLSLPAYRAARGENGGFILMHSVGSIPHGNNIDVPLNYADYYFLEALLKRKALED